MRAPIELHQSMKAESIISTYDSAPTLQQSPHSHTLHASWMHALQCLVRVLESYCPTTLVQHTASSLVVGLNFFLRHMQQSPISPHAHGCQDATTLDTKSHGLLTSESPKFWVPIYFYGLLHRFY